MKSCSSIKKGAATAMTKFEKKQQSTSSDCDDKAGKIMVH